MARFGVRCCNSTPNHWLQTHWDSTATLKGVVSTIFSTRPTGLLRKKPGPAWMDIIMVDLPWTIHNGEGDGISPTVLKLWVASRSAILLHWGKRVSLLGCIKSAWAEERLAFFGAEERLAFLLQHPGWHRLDHRWQLPLLEFRCTFFRGIPLCCKSYDLT